MQVERLKSVDAVRGFTIAAMILVNYPGSWSHLFPPLAHASWHGLTPTDLIFPFFLFVVGVSIVLAYTKQIHQGIEPKKLYGKILFRTLKIFALGLLLNYYHHFSLAELRVAGVLQRIALVFLVCSFLFLNTKWKTQLWVAIVLLFTYWVTMVFIPNPALGKVSLEPGTNFAAYIDSYILPGKMWQGTWDPEGLYSTIPAIATGIIGMLVGKLLISDLLHDRKIIWLFVIGISLSVIGYFWGINFPVNKNIWSSSFVLVTAGFASLVLAASMFLIDELKRDKIAKIGIIFGSNAIAVYVLADILSYFFYSMPIGGAALNHHFVSLFASSAPKLGSCIYAIMYVSINFIPAYILFKKRIFIRL